MAVAEIADDAGFAFNVHHRALDSHARLGRLTTPHGTLETPAFIFCATKGAMKALTPAHMEGAGADIILSNTYHLMIQPGADTVARLGGLHAMTGWSGPMLTDSGGFQIFSMGHGGVADEIKGRQNQPRESSLLKISEEGAEFRSYLDGRKLALTPETSIDIQRKLGPDLIVQLDECTPFHVDRDYTARSMAMSDRWGDRSLASFDRPLTFDGHTVEPHHAVAGHAQAMYGIIQGGVYPDLRAESCGCVADRPFFGTAIGGSLGQDKDQMYEVVGYCTPHLPPGRPVHLLGIGNFADIFAGVVLGVDTFDCVHPTRVARHGWALKKGAKGERINIRNARYREDAGPIDETCDCYACKHFSAGYIHHLIKAGEFLGMTLLSIHNVHTMVRLMREVRAAIRSGTLDEARRGWIPDAG